MKTVVFAVLAIGILSGCSQQGAQEAGFSNQENASSTDERAPNEIVMVVHGLSCPLCATNLRKKIMEIDGVEAVFPDLESGDVGIRYKEGKKPTNEQLEKAVKESGFTLVEIKE